MNINEILASNIGSSVENGKLKVSFRKTVNLRQYETEVLEADIEVPLTQENRLPLIEVIAASKLEYGVLFQMYASRMISKEEFDARKAQFEQAVTAQEQYVNSGFGLGTTEQK